MQHIDDRNVTQGDHVNFTCSFSHENDILDILWTLGNKNFKECEFAVQELDGCFTLNSTDNFTTSTFTIQNTSSLSAGAHQVRCTAVSLSENFTSDPSYIPDMFEVINDANMTIVPIIATAIPTPSFTTTQGKSACTFSHVSLKNTWIHTLHSGPDYSYLFIKVMLTGLTLA